MKREEDLNKEVDRMIADLGQEYADLGDEASWQIARALIHRAVHHAAERGAADYCVLSTYLADMIRHAHQLCHGQDVKDKGHRKGWHN